VVYAQFYSPMFELNKWLAQQSHFFYMLHRRISGALYDNEQRMMEDNVLLRNYASSASPVYLDNLRHMLKRCKLESMQPLRDITR